MDTFEGPEKKLEMIFDPLQTGLRSMPWHRIVRSAGAEILNRISTAATDGYLLSESSLFVWEDRLLMITCGKTSPVNALPEILEHVEKRHVAFLFYERKNMNFPHEQPTSYQADREFLSEYFPGLSTTLGRSNHDHIHLYYHANPKRNPPMEATLRILMHDISPSVGKLFVKTGRKSSVEHFISGLSCFNSAMVLDSHFFNPQGYSLNGLFGSHYLTLHVTPQPEASYTSFELSSPGACFGDIVMEVLDLFRPGRASVFLKTCRVGECSCLHDQIPEDLPRFSIEDSNRQEIDGKYIASLRNFRQNDAFT